MAIVKNWQLKKDMKYPYDDNRPNKQIAYVFDTNKCIAWSDLHSSLQNYMDFRKRSGKRSRSKQC